MNFTDPKQQLEELHGDLSDKKAAGNGKPNYIPSDMKPFAQTAFGRTLAGKNKTGRIIHSALDVLPIPNIHEVVKAVIKDEQAQSKVIGATGIIKETFKRLDWTRTIVGVLLVLAYIFDYVSIEKVVEIINALSGLFG